jgi:hypothetical protein
VRLTFPEIYLRWFYGDESRGPQPHAVIVNLKSSHEIRLHASPSLEYLMADGSVPIIARVDGGDPGDEDDWMVS